MRKTLFLLLLATPAYADRRVEVGLALGGHAFSTQVELGVADEASEPGPESSALLGARIAIPLVQRLAIEAEAMLIPTRDDVLGEGANVWGLRAHARFDLLTGRIKPFVVAGAGAHVIWTSSLQMDNDADRAYHWGGGVRVALSDKLEARLDARHLIVPDRTLDGATSDYEVTAGMTFRFGRDAKPIVIVPPAPVVPGDRDDDGLTDDVDQCVAKAEDVDNFEDSDGCPDPDNDNDGIVDTSDACAFNAETKNGWKDEDGCPDQVIAELTGIAFEVDSARIDDDSTPLLERAYVILKENPNLSIEISGHTSSEGDPDRNLALSLWRAEAVKGYLVKRGIGTDRIQTVGHGSDVPIADNRTEEGRSKNRRIEFRILVPAPLP